MGLTNPRSGGILHGNVWNDIGMIDRLKREISKSSLKGPGIPRKRTFTELRMMRPDLQGSISERPKIAHFLRLLVGTGSRRVLQVRCRCSGLGRIE